MIMYLGDAQQILTLVILPSTTDPPVQLVREHALWLILSCTPARKLLSDLYFIKCWEQQNLCSIPQMHPRLSFINQVLLSSSRLGGSATRSRRALLPGHHSWPHLAQCSRNLRGKGPKSIGQWHRSIGTRCRGHQTEKCWEVGTLHVAEIGSRNPQMFQTPFVQL